MLLSPLAFQLGMAFLSGAWARSLLMSVQALFCI